MQPLDVRQTGKTLARAICVSAFVAACNPTEPSAWDDFRRNRELWEAQRPASYEFVLQRYCGECLPEATVPLLVTVREREVLSLTRRDTNEPLAAEQYNPLTIDDLFTIIEAALSSGAYILAVEYARDLGYPTQIAIDYDRLAVDDEIGYSATELRPVQ